MASNGLEDIMATSANAEVEQLDASELEAVDEAAAEEEREQEVSSFFAEAEEVHGSSSS